MNPTNYGNSRKGDKNTNLDNFQAIKTKVVLFAVNLLPWGILLVSILALKESDVMLASGLLAAALSLFAFQRLMQQIPHTLTVLWRRNIIAERPNFCSDEAEAEEELRKIVPSSRSPQLISEFYKYVSNFRF